MARGSKSGRLSQGTAVFAVAVALALVFSLTLNGFATLGNLFALARSVSVLGILALGMAIVVISRGLDLSQVASLAVSAAIAIMLMNSGAPTLVALLVGLLLSVSVGIANGFLISMVEMPALFTTLASSLVVLGVTRTFAVKYYVVYLAAGHTDFQLLGGVIAGGLPTPLLIWLACAVLVHLFLTRTTLGRFIYVHGDNAEAAGLTGVAVRPLTMLEYALSSAIGYVGGVVMIAETGLMHLQVAESTLIFDVIMVVVLGGFSLVGGRGNVLGVLAGTLLIGVLLNGMTIMDLDIETQNIIKGVVLLGAIFLDSYVHPRDEETSKQGD
jgi:ribose transport system permease protein